MRRLFPASIYGSITIMLKTKRGLYMELSVPSVMVLCPCCHGRSIPGDIYSCELCNGRNVIEVVAEDFLTQYPKINQAMLRYDREEQAEAWERYGERVWGC